MCSVSLLYCASSAAARRVAVTGNTLKSITQEVDTVCILMRDKDKRGVGVGVGGMGGGTRSRRE